MAERKASIAMPPRDDHEWCFRHSSPTCGGGMPCLVFVGLTCTHANVTEKANIARPAPGGDHFHRADTPRGEEAPDDPDGLWDFGQGAGFYVDASEAPWDRHFNMWSYLADELPALVGEHLPADLARQSITGHSMGGHGALTLALGLPGRFKSVSAFSPIVAPSEVPWGRKALKHYLGEDRATWRRHDACLAIADGARVEELLVDIGTDDPFLEKELKPELLEAACAAAEIPLTLRRQAGYDHSYYFISTFMADHVAWHATRLAR